MPAGTVSSTRTTNWPGTGFSASSVALTAEIPGCEKRSSCKSWRSRPVTVTVVVPPACRPAGKTVSRLGLGRCPVIRCPWTGELATKGTIAIVAIPIAERIKRYMSRLRFRGIRSVVVEELFRIDHDPEEVAIGRGAIVVVAKMLQGRLPFGLVRRATKGPLVEFLDLLAVLRRGVFRLGETGGAAAAIRQFPIQG